MPLRIHTLAVLVALSGPGSTGAFASGVCDFYAGASYSGEAFTLYGGHVLLTGPVDSKSLNTITAGGTYQSFTDPRWKGRVTSVRVQKGCKAGLTDGARAATYRSDIADTGANGAIAYACVCR